MKSNKIIYTIAVLVSVIIGLGAFSYFNTKTATVYLFNDKYAAGTPFDQKTMVTPVTIDKKTLNPTSLKGSKDPIEYITSDNIKEFEGKYLVHEVYAGEQLSNKLLGDESSSPVETRLKPNMVGVSVKTDSVTVGSPYIKPDALVNVYVAYSEKNPEGDEIQKSKLLFENVRVLDILVDADEEGVPQPIGATLEVAPQDSVVLNFYTEFGSIKLGVVKPGQYKSVGAFEYSAGIQLPQAKKEDQTQTKK